MRNDKKSHMVRANKLFQERINNEKVQINNEKVFHIPDIHPQLSKLLK